MNLVTVLSIASLRELHASENSSCPKLLMRSEDLCYSSHCCSQKAARSSWETFFSQREKVLVFQTTKHLPLCMHMYLHIDLNTAFTNTCLSVTVSVSEPCCYNFLWRCLFNISSLMLQGSSSQSKKTSAVHSLGKDREEIKIQGFIS